jgi:hypothetical protein
MPKPTLTLALVAMAAVAAGLVADFIELAILGVIAALVAAAFWLRSARSVSDRR